MKKIQDITASIFIAAIVILTVVSFFGIWNVFHKDVITKSFETFGLLALVAVVVLVASKFFGNRAEVTMVETPNPVFKLIRKTTVSVLIIAASCLALIGVLNIWDVIKDSSVLNKAIASVILIAFSSFIVVIMSMQREGGEWVEKRGKEISAAGIVAIIIFAYLFFIFARFF